MILVGFVLVRDRPGGRCPEEGLPGRRHPEGGTREAAPGRRHQEGGTRKGAPGRGHQEGGTRKGAPGRGRTRDRAPGAKDGRRGMDERNGMAQRVNESAGRKSRTRHRWRCSHRPRRAARPLPLPSSVGCDVRPSPFSPNRRAHRQVPPLSPVENDERRVRVTDPQTAIRPPDPSGGPSSANRRELDLFWTGALTMGDGSL